MPHQFALHVRRHRAGLLVERNDAPGMHPRHVVCDDFVLGVQEMEAARIEPYVAENHDCEMRLQDVGKKRLVHPRAANRAAGIAEDDVENLETSAPCDRETRALDFAEHCCPCAGSQRSDRLHVAAVFVAERQPVEQVLDGDETGPLEIGRLTRPDALQVLERCREIGSQGTRPWHKSQRTRLDNACLPQL